MQAAGGDKRKVRAVRLVLPRFDRPWEAKGPAQGSWVPERPGRLPEAAPPRKKRRRALRLIAVRQTRLRGGVAQEFGLLRAALAQKRSGDRDEKPNPGACLASRRLNGASSQARRTLPATR